MKHYAKQISYLNLLMRYIRTPFILLLLILSIGQLGFASYTMYRSQFQYLRFEQLLTSIHIEFIVGIVFFLTCLLLLATFLRQQMHGKVAYTLARLPITKQTQFWLTVLHNMMVLLMVYCVQFVILLLTFFIYIQWIGKDAIANNALFLTFLRIPFLRKAFPITNPLLFLYWFGCLFFLSFTISYLGISIQTKHKWYVVVFMLVCFTTALSIESSEHIFYWFLLGTMGLYSSYMYHRLQTFFYKEANL